MRVNIHSNKCHASSNKCLTSSNKDAINKRTLKLPEKSNQSCETIHEADSFRALKMTDYPENEPRVSTL